MTFMYQMGYNTPRLISVFGLVDGCLSTKSRLNTENIKEFGTRLDRSMPSAILMLLSTTTVIYGIIDDEGDPMCHRSSWTYFGFETTIRTKTTTKQHGTNDKMTAGKTFVTYGPARAYTDTVEQLRVALKVKVKK